VIWTCLSVEELALGFGDAFEVGEGPAVRMVEARGVRGGIEVAGKWECCFWVPSPTVEMFEEVLAMDSHSPV